MGKPTPHRSKQMMSSNLRLPSMESEVPLGSSSEAAVASIPPIELETYSVMVDSASSSEGILVGSQTSKSPGSYDSTISPLPEEAPQLPSNGQKNSSSPPSSSAASMDSKDSPDTAASPANKPASPQDLKGVPDVPVICKKDRIRVMIQIPREVVGRFIGKLGRNIKALMADSNGAHVYVNQKNMPKEAQVVLCTIQGSLDQVNQAMKIIETRYPEIQIPDYQSGTEPPPGNSASPSPGNSASPSPGLIVFRTQEEPWDVELKPACIPSTSFSGMVCYIEKLTTVWLVMCDKSLQLDQQHQSMSYTYSYNSGQVARLRDASLLGKCCAVRVSEVHWLRGRLSRFGEDLDGYEVQLVDYGSIVVVPPSAIKPLRSVSNKLCAVREILVVLPYVCLSFAGGSTLSCLLRLSNQRSLMSKPKKVSQELGVIPGRGQRGRVLLGCRHVASQATLDPN